MRIRWLGWAGVELEADSGETLVIDVLEDAGAVFAPYGERAAGTPQPAIGAPRPGSAVAALVTHLHRDHADAAAISAALAPGAAVLEPAAGEGDALENLGLAQAEHELAEAGLDRRHLDHWESVDAGPFAITGLPAVDGLGDPQVAWLVEADGDRVLHLGDTMFHAFWWRIARRAGPFDVVLLPVNGAVVDFPHRQPPSPLPVVMTPEQAAVAAEILDPRVAVPIHAEGYELPGAYTPSDDAARRFAHAAGERGVRAETPALGEAFEVGSRV